MAVTESARHQLHTDLAATIGQQSASTLMEHLPPVGWADVATKHDLAQLEERLELRFTGSDLRFTSVDQQFTSVDQRFDAVDQRFDAVDQRFDAVDQRFDAVDQRFNAVDQRLDGVDRRLDGVDRRLDLVDQRLGAIDRQMEGLNERLFQLQLHFNRQLLYAVLGILGGTTAIVGLLG